MHVWNNIWYSLLSCRYTFFIIAYPTGVTGWDDHRISFTQWELSLGDSWPNKYPETDHVLISNDRRVIVSTGWNPVCLQTGHPECPSSKQSECKFQLSLVHPHHHAPLHPLVPSHVHAHVLSKKKGAWNQERRLKEWNKFFGFTFYPTLGLICSWNLIESFQFLHFINAFFIWSNSCLC